MNPRIGNCLAKWSRDLGLALRGKLSDRTKCLAAVKAIGMAFLVGGFALATGGCAGYYEPGYSRAYYTPDYAPYYGDYGYGGESYPGFAGGYSGELIVGGVRHRDYYGNHHFGHDFNGARGGSFRSGGSHVSGHGGRGSSHR